MRVFAAHSARGGLWAWALVLSLMVSGVPEVKGGSGSEPAATAISTDTVDLPTESSNPGVVVAREVFQTLRFRQPVYACAAPSDDHNLYVVERGGMILRAHRSPSGDELAEVFLDLTPVTHANPFLDDGMLGLAFHPTFGQDGARYSGDFFVYYITEIGGHAYYRLARFTVATPGGPADPESEEVLIQQLDRNPIHNGGSLLFGPDGCLYLSIGDEGSQADPFQSSQKIDDGLFSGILRIDVDRRGGALSHPPKRQPARGRTAGYHIPKDNPFIGVIGALEEFWAIGFRSPHRMSWDAGRNAIWLGDVGGGAGESIELARPGTNHQWSYREGRSAFTYSYLRGTPPSPPVGIDTNPLFDYPHENGNRAVIGGYVYRGSELPQLHGCYIFGDSGSSRIWAMKLRGDEPVAIEMLTVLPTFPRAGITSFGVDAHGEILICVMGEENQRDGRVYRLGRGTGE